MNQLKNLYPASPDNINPAITNPSPEFKRNIMTVMGAIALFIVVYFVLILLGLGLLIASFYAAFWLFTAIRLHWFTIAIGLGLMALGLMFFVFLIKFIFVSKQNNDPLSIEIKPSEHPQLFEFIRQLVQDTKAPYPKKVFLSPDVNACVFYNSSFWSMFLPVRKNLQIGLGLVNSLNMSEFKAVLAHEFGHFSQKSMKLGSYVYTVNNALYNLVYEYDNWDEWLAQWAATGGVFGFFAIITNAMVSAVRAILKKAYEIINIRYLSLSREMEYHADLVALSVSGGDSMKNALRRIEFGAEAYAYSLRFLQKLADTEKAKTKNIYAVQSQIIHHFIEINKLAEDKGLPIITDEALAKNTPQRRVIYKDQWASHPTLEERERNLARFPIEVLQINESPWLLFSDGEELQLKITQLVYKLGIPEVEKMEVIDNEMIIEKLKADYAKANFLNYFDGFYKGRDISIWEVEKMSELSYLSEDLTYEMVYSAESTPKIEKLLANEQDLAILQAIDRGEINVKYFEFDGQKYPKKQVKKVFQILNEEVESQKKWLLEAEKKAFCFHYQKAKSMGSENAETYYQLYLQQQIIQKELNSYDALGNRLTSFYYKVASIVEWEDEDVKNNAVASYALVNEFKNCLAKSEKIQLATKIGDIDLGKSYRDYLLPESVIILSNTTFNGESFMKFYQQIADTLQRLDELYGHSFKQLIEAQKAYS
jgi:Zn-dependent protease with chaperone function